MWGMWSAGSVGGVGSVWDVGCARGIWALGRMKSILNKWRWRSWRSWVCLVWGAGSEGIDGRGRSIQSRHLCGSLRRRAWRIGENDLQ